MRRNTSSRRTRAAAVAVGLLVAVTGCGSSDSSDAASESTPSTSPSRSPSTSPSGSPTSPTDEQLGKVVAGAPKDLTWGVAQVPASWRKLVEKAGELQWAVGQKCVLTLQQPGGLKEKEPVQDRIVSDGVAYLERATKVDLTQGALTRRQFPVRSNLDGAAASTAVSVAGFTGPRGVQGQVFAHRSGEFALVLLTVCSGGSYAAVEKSDLGPFIDSLVVRATY